MEFNQLIDIQHCILSMGISGHSGCELDGSSIDDKLTVAVMVNGLGVLLRWVDPGFDHFENEQVATIASSNDYHFVFCKPSCSNHVRLRSFRISRIIHDC